MLDAVKLALRITATMYDDELTSLIAAATLDLSIAGINTQNASSDALLKRAIITYVRVHFGSPSDFDRLKASYDEQKAQLQTATKYHFDEEDE